MRVLVPLVALLFVACVPVGSSVGEPERDPHDGGAVSYEILEVREGRDLLVQTPLGPLRVDWGVGLQTAPAPPEELDRVLAHVRASELELGELTLYRTPLAGVYLYSSEFVVLPEGVLVAADAAALRARAGEQNERALADLRRAIDRTIASLERHERDPSSRAATSQILEQLDQKGNVSASFDVLPASFARRLVRHGWLAELDADEAAKAELEAAVGEAGSLRPLTRYASARSRLVYSEDAFGEGAWVLQTPERSGYSRLAPPPAYYTQAEQLILVVHLPPGTDPAAGEEGWRAAEVYHGDLRLAGWDRDGGFRANELAWRQLFPASGGENGEHELQGALPPHVLVTRLDGDVLALITEYGTLTPATDGSPEQVERFFDEAAEALPDAAHLDLIGEYLLVYVYDSPDPRRPSLVGTLQWSGDIHQTASQTLETHTGGMYRGDCDDLSELYQEIAERQGKNAHLIGLPAHAALAWSERGDDATWRTYLLQTGRPLEFRAASLDASLQELYELFGAGEVLDTTRLEVLLRFSGQNTRSSWFLSSRIFSDPEYARTMIDVQRDWHFQTYHRAIRKMKRMIESGDRDPANLAELAGLYRYTGQYDASAALLERAHELLSSEESRLSLQVDRVEVLYAADRRDEARALVHEILDVRVPRLEAQLQVTLLDPALALVDALVVDGNDFELALEVLARRLTPGMDEAMRALVEWTESDDFDPKHWRDGGDDQVRHQLRRYAGNSIAVLRAMSGMPLAAGEDWKRVAESLELWFSGVAFHDVEGPETVLRRYALLGRYYEALHGRDSFHERISSSPPPHSAERAHTARAKGSAPVDADVAWASVAPSFWAGAQRDLFGPRRVSVDAKHVVALAERVELARDQARELGLSHPSFEGHVHTSALLAAIFARDHGRLRLLFRAVKRANDREQLLETASWIAALARFLPLDQYADVLEIWRQELNYKPMYFWIAWNAALSGAGEHALLVAELAANQFHDDPAFVEEYEFMRSLPDLGHRARSRPGRREAGPLSSW